MQVYALPDSIRDLLLPAQASGLTRGLVLHATSPRPTQTVALGGYLFEARLSRSWPANTIVADDGAILIVQASPGEFYIVGAGVTVSFARGPDVDSGIAEVQSIEQVSRHSGQWTIESRLNGDQSNQGRQLPLDPHQHDIYRVKLHSIPSEPHRIARKSSEGADTLLASEKAVRLWRFCSSLYRIFLSRASTMVASRRSQVPVSQIMAATTILSNSGLTTTVERNIVWPSN